DITSASGNDVHIKDAIVFIGDGVTDVYSTSYTSDGNNQMAGTEILAQALDTISRHSWPVRMTFLESITYLLFVAVLAGSFWVLWKALQQRLGTRRKLRQASILRLAQDLCVSVLLVAA